MHLQYGLLKRIEWGWLFWSVLVPTMGPPFFTLLVFGAWMTFATQAKPDIKSIVADLSPWALCFFGLTLIGASINEMGFKRFAEHRALGVSMAVVGIAALGYAVLLALFRAMGKDVAHAPVYYVTFVLWALAVVLCHWSYLVKSRPLPSVVAAAAAQPNHAVAPAGVRA